MSRKSSSLKRERTSFEWAILAASTAAIAAIIAGLIVSSLGYQADPAVLRTTIEPQPDAANRYLVSVTNEGGATAIEVRVLVRRGSGSVEVEFRAVPKGDVEEAFVHIGGRGRPTAQIQSYKEP